MVGENVLSRHRIAEPVLFAEAREGPQILRIGPQGVMSDAAFIAARIDESGVIEVRHAELLWWGSGSSAQAGQCSIIGICCGNDNGTQYSFRLKICFGSLGFTTSLRACLAAH